MGRRSLRLLLETMESSDDAPPHFEVTPELIVRASTAAPRPA
jgi:DNA-binding LacI/PurR family transcriptional regulator